MLTHKDNIKLIVFVQVLGLVFATFMNIGHVVDIEKVIDAQLMLAAFSVVSAYVLAPLLLWWMDL